MNHDSRRRQKQPRPSSKLNEPRAVTGVERLSNDAVDLINRALFEEWLQRHGTWDAFLKAAQKDKPGPDDPTTKH